jgi:hypothetical protein
MITPHILFDVNTNASWCHPGGGGGGGAITPMNDGNKIDAMMLI